MRNQCIGSALVFRVVYLDEFPLGKGYRFLLHIVLIVLFHYCPKGTTYD